MNVRIDHISEDYLHLIFSLNNYLPGLVSEYWGDETVKQHCEANPIKKDNLERQIKRLTQRIEEQINDQARKAYLLRQVNGLLYLAEEINGRSFKLKEYFRAILGFELNKVDEQTVNQKVKRIRQLSHQLGIQPREFTTKFKIEKQKLLSEFNRLAQELRRTVNKQITLPESESFDVTLVNHKPWGAYNYHLAPFKSRIEINTDVPLTDLDLKSLVVHELYGGHHTELSLKDQLLVKQGRGEHAIVNVFSSQSFISEGIAEFASNFFEVYDQSDLRTQLFSELHAVGNIKTNNLAFYISEDHWTADRVLGYLLTDDLIPEEKADQVCKFVTDPIWGRYVPWYYQGKRYISDTYHQLRNRKKFIQHIYLQPIIT